jgi:hypothetical protein
MPEILKGAKPNLFGVECKKCGHVTWFDKTIVCRPDGTVPRIIVQEGDVELDELYLKCGNEKCGEKMTAHVNCEGYK